MKSQTRPLSCPLLASLEGGMVGHTTTTLGRIPPYEGEHGDLIDQSLQ